jgi:uncharacterized protein YjbI with pentapeptide repeats
MATRRKKNPEGIGSDGTGTVKGYTIGPGVDLSGADLTGANLTGANLFRANLTGTELSRVYLFRANLTSANLTGAKLPGANLTGTRLDDADLTGADLRASLYQANLSGANLTGANLNGADLSGANLSGANLSGAKLTGANLYSASLYRANLTSANLTSANLESANLYRANLTGANLTSANLTRAGLSDANLAEADLSDADLTRANLSGAKYERAQLAESRFDEKTVFSPGMTPLTPPNRRETATAKRVYGVMTGPVLKMIKPDSPVSAKEFKRKYPAEAEKLTRETQGRDYSDSVKASIRQKYLTPFDWLVTTKKYTSEAQRKSPKPNTVFLLNIDLNESLFSQKQLDLLSKLASVSQRSGHPHEKKPLFTVGWVRVNTEQDPWLIEEVQSDVQVVRKQIASADESALDQLRNAGISEQDFSETFELMRPYTERFYEDAIGIIFEEAEKLGYGVEMLGYEDKREFRSPVSVYNELPRKMGMVTKRESQALPGMLTDRVSFYKPNPGKRRSRMVTKTAKFRRK